MKMNIDYQQIIKDKKVYSRYKNDFFDTFMEEKVPEANYIPFEWKGGLIDFETYQKIINFFLWTYQGWQGESQVRLWYNTETKEWATYPMPQEITKGSMATTDSYCEEVSKLFPPPWIDFGTGHHHCSAGAFASGQDIKNEQNQDGFHFTIGNLDKNKLDLHARFSWSGQLFPCHISDFVAGPEWLQEAPDNTYYQMLDIMLRTPPECPDFPKQWKQQVTEKIIKPVSKANTNWKDYNWKDWNTNNVTPYEKPVFQDNDVTMEVSDIAYLVANSLTDNPYDVIKAFAEKVPDVEHKLYIQDVEELIEGEISISPIKVSKEAVSKEVLNILRSQISKDERTIRKTKNLQQLQSMTGADEATPESINYEIYENGITIDDLL